MEVINSTENRESLPSKMTQICNDYIHLNREHERPMSMAIHKESPSIAT